MTHGINSTSHSGSKKQVLTLVYCLSVTDAEKLDPSSPWILVWVWKWTPDTLTADREFPSTSTKWMLCAGSSVELRADVISETWIPHVTRDPQCESLGVRCARVRSNQVIYPSWRRAAMWERHTSVRASATGLPGGAAVFMWEEGSKLCFTLSDGSLDGAIKNETSRIQFFLRQ